MADSPSSPTADPRLADMSELIALVVGIAARRVRAAFAASIADPATDPGERSRMRRLLGDQPQTPDQRSRP